MKKLIFLLFLSWLLIGFNLKQAQSFSEETRRTMIKDAIKFCPQSLQTHLTNNTEAIKSGMFFIERNPQIRISSRQVETWHKSLVSELEGEVKFGNNTMDKFGFIAGFIADTINPSYVRSSRLRVPQASERNKIIYYDGYEKISDINKKMEELSNTYSLYYSFNKVEGAIIDKAYSDAVNQIADCWVTAWEESGNEIRLSEAEIKIDHTNPAVFSGTRRGETSISNGITYKEITNEDWDEEAQRQKDLVNEAYDKKVEAQEARGVFIQTAPSPTYGR